MSTPKKLKRSKILAAGSFFSVLPCANISVSPAMEESLALSVADFADHQFTSRVWLAYDRAFREHAAATNLTDWSTLNVQLFNFHAAGASIRIHDALTDSSEPQGAASAAAICSSWNWGQCIAPFASCRFAYKCQSY